MKNFSAGKTAAMVAGLALLARIVGFGREILLGISFGPSQTLDIYFTAFRLPDIVYNLLILGTLSVAFIPVFTSYYHKDKNEALNIASNILNIAVLVMCGLCAILFIFGRPLTSILAPGFSGEAFDQTVNLTRLMLLSPLLFTISSVFGSFLTSMKRFLIISLAPIFYNLGIIFGLFVLYPHWGLAGLGVGVTLGALIHTCIQMTAAFRAGFRWRPYIDLRNQGVRKVAALFLPRVLALDISFVSLVIASMIGSVLPAGTISTYNFAYNLQTVAIGVFAISIISVIFPILSELHARGDTDHYINAIVETTIRVLFFMIPITILLFLFRAHIVRLAYAYGQFDWEETILTFRTVGVLTWAVISQSLIPLFARAFYAKHNTKTPFLISIGAMIINAVIAYASAPTYGVLGIALGFTIASIFNCLALFVLLRRDLGKTTNQIQSRFDRPLITIIGKTVFAALAMGVVSYGLLYALAKLVDTHTVLGIFAQTLTASVGGIATYFLLAYALGLPEVKAVWRFLNK